MKTVQSIFFICFIVLTATLCGAEEPLEPTSADVYREQGVTVVLPVEWKPFSFVDEAGERTGYLFDLWTAWAKHAEIDVRFEFKNEQDALQSMADNATEIHGGLRYTDEHAETLDYTDSVQSSTSVLAIREDGSVSCADAMSHGKIGLVDEPDTVRMMEGKYPNSRLFGYADERRVITAFMDGKVDGVVVGYPYLVEMDKEQPVLDTLNICRTLLYHEVYAGVQKDQTELLALVNDGLSDIPAEEFKQIEKRWFLTAEKPKPKWLAASLPAVVVVVLMIGIVVVWIRRRP